MDKTNERGATVNLSMRPERHFIPASGDFRHINFHIQVEPVPTKASVDRMPLILALVLDRSGSMQGEKIATAKRAALSVLDRLDERDHVAVVVFDNQIDTLQAVAPVTTSVKANVRRALDAIEARANTALHEGWLTGCQAIARDTVPVQKGSLARCFLLTDGLANVGITDPEQIATEAAGIREHAGIGTSTFGIGDDYNEALLGPMAVAGGGQFHHLRAANEIVNTFIGELGSLLTVAASQVHLEIVVEPGISIDPISIYWTHPSSAGALQQSIAIGDLQHDEERHVVVRFGFPMHTKQDGYVVRARVVWVADGKKQSSGWQEVRFSYADQHTCEGEAYDPRVMHWVGLHSSDHAQREALELNRRGDLQGARKKLASAAQSIQAYAGSDKELQDEVAKLQGLESEVARAPLSSPAAKERYYQHQARSRGQRDHRTPDSAIE